MCIKLQLEWAGAAVTVFDSALHQSFLISTVKLSGSLPGPGMDDVALETQASFSGSAVSCHCNYCAYSKMF